MRVRAHVALDALNTFRVAANCRYLVTLEQPDDAWRFLDDARFAGLPRLVLGGGSNILFVDDYPGVVVRVAMPGREWLDGAEDAHRLRVGAGEAWHATVRHSVEAGRGGLENLSLIPGLAGAAPVQNIGAYGIELKDRFESLQAVDLDNGGERVFSLDECDFAYRHSRFKREPGRWLITSVVLRLPRPWEPRLDYPGVAAALAGKTPTPARVSDTISAIRQRKLPDPADIGNAGSFFKNPIVSARRHDELKARFPDMPGFTLADGRVKLSAAWLIDRCGLRGRREGDAGVYPGHALVLVNHGRASGADLWRLAARVRVTVAECFDVSLEPEPLIVANSMPNQMSSQGQR